MSMSKNEYRYLHYWVERQMGKPMICHVCGVLGLSVYHWANISGHYKKDISDWKRMCPKCHKNFDKTGFCRKNLHKLTKTNTYIAPKTSVRECLTCRRRSRKAYYWKHKEQRVFV